MATIKKETRNFQAEVSQVLDMMINSLYSHREIFLRELISNSSDALDKLSFAEVKSPELAIKDKHIRLHFDKDKNTLEILDNGIGMSAEDVEKNLGTIAYSGTKNFLKNADKLKNQPELIGQFGVGFYSSFMVANKVTVITQKAGSSAATIWSSEGKGSYTIEQGNREEGCGTSVILNLKPQSSEEKKEQVEFQDFCDEWTLKSTIKKYSDFIEYPIYLKVTRQEPKKDKDGKEIKDQTETVIKDETLNSQKALWTRDSKDIKKEEHVEFYKHITNDWQEPLETIHYRAEGNQEFIALMYIPSAVPFDYNYRETKYGLSLYVKRVFINNNCEELIPQYMRFIKGLVDSSDLPLNVSREIIQKDRQIQIIKKAITAKVFRHLKGMLSNDRKKYCDFWDKFGASLKEGMASDHSNKDTIADVSLFNSTHSKEMSTLKEYIDRMPAEQKDIYYISGESTDQIISSPYLEKLKKKNYEVLLLTDPVDEWVMNSLPEYKKKKLVSITSEKLDLDSENEKQQNEKQLKGQKDKYKSLCETIKDSLKDLVKDVRVTDRLVDSPVCLVNGEAEPSAHMQRILEKIGQSTQDSKRVLELNPNHPIFEKMLNFKNKNKTIMWAQILYNQALLNEGSKIKDPTNFTKNISELMLSA